MAVKTVLDNQWATVRYNSTPGYVYHTFHKPIGGNEFRNVLNTGLDTLAQNRAQRWLSDDRKNAEFTQEDAEFAIADWGPRAAQAGWRYWALVVPEDVAGRASMQGIVQAFHNLGVWVNIFTDLDKAREWIETVK